VLLADSSNLLSVTKVIDSLITNGRVQTRTYDRASRTLTTRTPAGRQLISFYDSLGTLVKDSIPGLFPDILTYDAGGRLVRDARGARLARYFFGSRGLKDSTSNALGEAIAFRYDTVANLVLQVLNHADTIRVRRDSSGNLAGITPPGRPEHRFTYAFSGRPDSYRPPAVPGESSAVFQRYTSEGKLSQVLRPDGTDVMWTYDGSGGVTAASFGGDTVRFGYDAVTGQVTSLSGPAGEGLTYTYDGFLAKRRSLAGPVTGYVETHYDSDFRPDTLRVNGVPSVVYSYDADGFITAAGPLSVTRDARNGLLTRIALGQITTSVVPDGYGEDSIETTTSGSTVLLQRAYTRNVAGRITGVAETLNGVTTVFAYTYDSVGRLAQVTKDGVAIASYEYGANSNRVRAVYASGAVTGTYDGQDRLLSYGSSVYRYSPNGGLSVKKDGADSTKYSFDALDRLRSVVLSTGTVVSYVYDGEGRLVGRSRNAVLSQGFLYAPNGQLVAETGGDGSVIATFAYATRPDVPDFVIKGDTTYRIVAEPNGSVRLVVNTQTGNVTQQLEYDPFGRVTNNSNPDFQPFGFGGGLYDSDTRLIHLGVRFYDAETGRWISRDPILFAGKSTNLYTYASSAPIDHSDPTGTFTLAELAEFDLMADEIANINYAQIKNMKRQIKVTATCVNGFVDAAFADPSGSPKAAATGVATCFNSVVQDFLVDATLGKLADMLTDAVPGNGAISWGTRVAAACLLNGAKDFASKYLFSKDHDVDDAKVAAVYGCFGGMAGQGIKYLAYAKNPFYGPLASALVNISFHVSEAVANATIERDEKAAGQSSPP